MRDVYPLAWLAAGFVTGACRLGWTGAAESAAPLVIRFARPDRHCLWLLQLVCCDKYRPPSFADLYVCLVSVHQSIICSPVTAPAPVWISAFPKNESDAARPGPPHLPNEVYSRAFAHPVPLKLCDLILAFLSEVGLDCLHFINLSTILNVSTFSGQKHLSQSLGLMTLFEE